MKISLRWLSRYVDLADKTPEQIRNDLTLSTAEVEGIEVFGKGLDEIVVGRVAERQKHPDADKLSLTKVDVGQGELVSIVCGAPNVAQGQYVAVILPGSTLPDGTKIKKTKIRGAESCGMICSERELGISEEHDGILVLEGTPVLGTRLVDAMALVDHVFEIDNKSINHRPDLWGHYGFARELAAIYGKKLAALPAAVTLPTAGKSLPIRIEDADGCPRYLGLVIEGATIAPSPAWLARLLRAVGLRPINNVVDVTNFVMLDLGQPLHAFDLGTLAADGIVVRRARNGETMKTLDGQPRSLVGGDLLITSGGKPVAIAGVMGGEESGVTANTKTLFLEAAAFHATSIRRTSTRLALRTDASTRYEKALDPAFAEQGAYRFLDLLQQVCPGARAGGPLVDAGGWKYPGRTLTLRKSRLAAKLGVNLEDEVVAKIFASLHFGVRVTADAFLLDVPSFRATKDILVEDDLIEEVGRMYRYDNIQEEPLRVGVAVPQREDELWIARKLTGLAATELGCNEIYNYSFVPDALVSAVLAEDLNYVRVTNPVAPEITRIRRHVLPSTLSTVAQNLREHAEVRLVEHGKGYHGEARDVHGLPREVREFAFVWARRDGGGLYRELRTGIETLLRRMGFSARLEELCSMRDLPWVHPGKTVAAVRGSIPVGYVGVLHPLAAKRLMLPETTAIATIDVRACLESGRDDERFVPIPRFPSQPVDIALLVAETTPVHTLTEFLRTAGKHVRDVALFEVYRGEGVEAGKKSVNFTVTLGAEDRTLTAADEEKYIQRVRERCSDVGAELRG